MNKIKVTDCNNCPFADYTIQFLAENDCENHCRATEDFKDLYRSQDVDNSNFGKLIHPDWCPLKTEEINVVLIKK